MLLLDRYILIWNLFSLDVEKNLALSFHIWKDHRFIIFGRWYPASSPWCYLCWGVFVNGNIFLVQERNNFVLKKAICMWAFIFFFLCPLNTYGLHYLWLYISIAAPELCIEFNCSIIMVMYQRSWGMIE